MPDDNTTAVVQRYLDALAGSAPSEPTIRDLLARAVRRLHHLSASILHHSFPRLTRPPLNLQTDELLGAVVERLLKALREARPVAVRRFYALAGQHMRWELNDLARRSDKQAAVEELRDWAAASSSPLPTRWMSSSNEGSGGTSRSPGSVTTQPVAVQLCCAATSDGFPEFSVRPTGRRH